MKQFENKNGTFMVSGGVEVDTDDLVEPHESEQDKTLRQLKEAAKKLAELRTEEDKFPSKSTCLIHIYKYHFGDGGGLKISGTLEGYKKYYKKTTVPSYASSEYIFEIREIIFWVGYDALLSITSNASIAAENIEKITLEHIAGHEDKFLEKIRFNRYGFEIMEINGPLFKIKLELASVA